MRSFNRTVLFLFAIGVACALAGAVPARAQWTELANRVLSAPDQHMGALRFRDGVAWIGTTGLAYSTDTGATWNAVPSFTSFSAVTDIAIYDKLHIFVATDGDGLYLTSDGGASWQNLAPGGDIDYTQCAFNGSASELDALSAGMFYTSPDAGVTWNSSGIMQGNPTGSLCFAIDRNQTIYVQSDILLGVQDQGWINTSTDLGNTWSGRSQYTDGDCETLAADSCTAGKLYLVNENVAVNLQTRQQQSRIDLTPNAGQSWQTTSAFGFNYYSGALSSTSDVLYVGTFNQRNIGIVRSTDFGLTWQNTGGPMVEYDTRTIAAVNDNIVLVLDDNGNVWRTLNSGGNPIVEAFSVSPNTLFQTDTISCDSLERTVQINLSGSGGCAGIASISFTGDTSSYRLVSAGPDSAAVVFSSLADGPHLGKMIILLSNGAADTVALAGTTELPADHLVAPGATLFSTDTIACDSVLRSIPLSQPCQAIAVSNAVIAGPNAASYRIATITTDSVSVRLIGTQPGDQHALLILSLDNGLTDTVQLEGNVNTNPEILSMTTQDVQTDTLGGTVKIPIVVHGLSRPEVIELQMSYNGTVDYVGSFSPTGVSIDVPNADVKGKAYLQSAGPVDSIVGYAEFNVFNDSNKDASATFDSLVVVNPVSVCSYTPPSAVTSTITPLFGCGIQMLSEYIHLGRSPVFNIEPNPSNGTVYLTSNLDVGDATIEIYDMLGTKRSELPVSISASGAIEVSLPAPSGVYTIAVHFSAGTAMMRVVEER